MFSSWFFSFLTFILLLFDIQCHPPARSSDREKLKNIKTSCYFSINRIPNEEAHERVTSTEVSTTCKGNLKKMDTLLGETRADLFGTSSRLDLGISRSGVYSKSEDDLKPFAEKLICDGHEQELVSRWSNKDYRHIKRKMQAVCSEHHQKILSIIEEYNDSDMEWKPSEEKSSSESVSAYDLIKRALYALADALGLTGFMTTRPFPSYPPDTQRKKTDIGYKVYRTVLSELAPGYEETLHNMIERRFHPRNWDRYLEHDADAVVRVVAELYQLAPNKRMSDFTLSLLAGKLDYRAVLRHIPDLSYYKYHKARKIARSGKFFPIVDDQKLVRYDTEGVIELIIFITSPLVQLGLPYGERVVILSNGQELRIPNTIRMMSQAEIVRQFTAYMIAIGKEKHLLSPSSIIRILNAIPATKAHSMTCVDSFLAKSYYSFQDLLKIIDRLHEIAIIDKVGQTGWRNDVLEGQLYLRTDFKLHVKMDSLIADHCLTFGLSDPEDPAFRKQCNRQHNEQCSRCVHLSRTFKELLKLLSDAVQSATTDDVKNELKEMHFKVRSHQDIIERLKYHEFRSVFTQQERQRIIDGLTNGQCMITADFAQKWVAHYYMEEQKQYYGKAGLPWHVSHSLCRLEEQFVQHAFVHLLMNTIQDSVVASNILNHVCAELKKVGITTVFVRSDNGGISIVIASEYGSIISATYHSAATLGSIPDIIEKTGMSIDSWSFSERQNGKSSADRIIAQCKGIMLRYFETGKNVYSTHDMFEALRSNFNFPRGLSVYEVNVLPPAEAEKNKWKLPGIQDMGHFKYETGDEGKITMRYWKFHGIGPGKTVTELKPNAGLLVVSNRASRTFADPSIVQDELARLRSNQECRFWLNDVDRNTVDEVYDADDEPGEGPPAPPPKTKPPPPDLLHYCWCGSSFIRFQNLLNHLEWGEHKICPEKVTLTDFALETFKKKVEDRDRTSSLLPLDDLLDDTADVSVPFLTEGFALYKRAHGGALPESSRSFAVKYYEEMKAKGIRADPEEAMHLQNQAPEVPFEDRLTLEQMKSLYCRLTNKKGKVKRNTDGEPMEVDDDEDEDSCGLGEWDHDCRKPSDPEEDPVMVIYKFIQDNKATLFLP